MKTIEYTLVPAEVPKLKTIRLGELVSEFRASGLGTAKVEGTEGRDGAMRARTYLGTYIRRSGISDVKVVIRGDHVYLVRDKFPKGG